MTSEGAEQGTVLDCVKITAAGRQINLPLYEVHITPINGYISQITNDPQEFVR